MTLKPWTDERVELLRQRWRHGLSASEIAIEMGVTRNAVIGKVHRLDLEERGQGKNPRQIANRLTARKQGDGRAVLKRRTSPIRTRPKLVEVKIAVSEAALNIALMDLQPGMCRWPTSDGKPMLFCGCAADEGKPYCATHTARAYVQVEKKRVRAPREYHATTDFDWTLRFGRAA